MTYLEKLLEGIVVEWKNLDEVTISIKTGLNPRQNFKLNTTNATNYYVTVKEITSGKIRFSEKTDMIDNQAVEIIQNRSKLEKDDVLFSGIGTIGKVAIVDIPTDNWNCSESVFLIKPNINLIEPKYLMYFLGSKESKEQYERSAVGSTLRGVRMETLKNLQIPIPPLEIQQKIVANLDTLTENTTVLKAELTTELTVRKKQYEFYRGKLLNFDERTIDWLTLGEVCDVFTGGEPPENSVKGSSNNEIFKYPIFGNGVEVYGYADTYRIDKDAVTISSIGANTGTIYFRKAYFTPIIRLKVVIPKTDNLLPRFLFHYLVSINITSKSSSVPNMNASDVKKIKVPILPIIEQERIANILDKFDTLTASISEGLPKEIELRKKQYEYYRDMLLSFPK